MSQTAIDAEPVTATADRAGWPSLYRPRAVALGLTALGLAAGIAAGAGWSAGPVSATEGDLVRLLRLMAALKLATALGAAWLVDWRLRAPAGARFAWGYPVAVALMASAPGLIWFIAPVIAGAAMFHAGLLLLLALAYVDRDGTRRALDAAIRRDNYRHGR